MFADADGKTHRLRNRDYPRRRIRPCPVAWIAVSGAAGRNAWQRQGAVLGRRSTNHLFEITEGVIRLYRIIGEGRRVITAFLFPGDIVGASLQDRYLYTAEAVTDCRIRRIGRKTFHDEVSRSPCLRPDLIALLCRETAAAHDQMVLLSKKNAEERLCSFLHDLLRRGPAGAEEIGAVSLPMSRLDIADYLGLTIETVSRTITKLANRGVLTPVGRHEIRILQPRRLAHLSGDGRDGASLH